MRVIWSYSRQDTLESIVESILIDRSKESVAILNLHGTDKYTISKTSSGLLLWRKTVLFYYRYYSTVYVTARQPAPQDFNMTMAVFPPYNNIKHDGIASSISGVQLQTMWWRIDRVSKHQLETSSTRNGRILTLKHLLLSPSSYNGYVWAVAEYNIKRVLDTMA